LRAESDRVGLRIATSQFSILACFDHNIHGLEVLVKCGVVEEPHVVADSGKRF